MVQENTALPLEPEVLEKPKGQVVNKNLISIMVLSMSLARAIIGHKVDQLTPEEGAKVVKHIEETMMETFPEVATLILGMYGMELMAITPILKDPMGLVKEMVSQYNDNSSSKLHME